MKNRKFSKVIVDGAEQAPSRSMLRGVGFTDEDFKKPHVGIASLGASVTPCNMHLDDLTNNHFCECLIVECHNKICIFPN